MPNYAAATAQLLETTATPNWNRATIARLIPQFDTHESAIDLAVEIAWQTAKAVSFIPHTPGPASIPDLYAVAMIRKAKTAPQAVAAMADDLTEERLADVTWALLGHWTIAATAARATQRPLKGPQRPETRFGGTSTHHGPDDGPRAA